VYITSNLYWRHPEINSIYRKIDIIASICLVSVGTKIAFDLGGYALMFWIISFTLQAALYTLNYFIYKKNGD